MVYSLFDERPSTVSFGKTNKGAKTMFLTFGIQGCENGGWEGWQERVSFNEGENPIANLHEDFLLKATEDELAEAARLLDQYDNADWWREVRIAQIRAFDNSDGVNQFFVDGFGMWLDKATRVGLVNSVSVEYAAGRLETALWYGTKRFYVSTSMAISMLSAVELYAIDCYNLTASHIAAVENMMSVDELKTFDIRQGYPTKPSFTTIPE